MDSIYAEMLVLSKRTATWILLAVATLLSLFSVYVGPYLSYLSRPPAEQTPADLRPMLPENLLATVLEGFPFYIGMTVLILGVLTFGSEYGWGTLKTTLMQWPNRIRLLGAKLAALGVLVLVITVLVFLVSALASLAVAASEGVTVQLPSALDFVRSLGAGWLILALWAVFGALLAIISRGTAMAIGLGILYGLVIEGLVSAFASDIVFVQDLTQGFLRANAYSLIQPMGAAIPEGGEPGAFPGPFVNAWQAFLVIVGYLIVFSGISALVLQRRDIS